MRGEVLVGRALVRAYDRARGSQRPIALTMNGAEEVEVGPRLTLADFLRERPGLTGTHLGGEQGCTGFHGVVEAAALAGERWER